MAEWPSYSIFEPDGKLNTIMHTYSLLTTLKRLQALVRTRLAMKSTIPQPVTVNSKTRNAFGMALFVDRTDPFYQAERSQRPRISPMEKDTGL